MEKLIKALQGELTKLAKQKTPSRFMLLRKLNEILKIFIDSMIERYDETAPQSEVVSEPGEGEKPVDVSDLPEAGDLGEDALADIISGAPEYQTAQEDNPEAFSDGVLAAQEAVIDMDDDQLKENYEKLEVEFANNPNPQIAGLMARMEMEAADRSKRSEEAEHANT